MLCTYVYMSPVLVCVYVVSALPYIIHTLIHTYTHTKYNKLHELCTWCIDVMGVVESIPSADRKMVTRDTDDRPPGTLTSDRQTNMCHAVHLSVCC